MRTDELRRELHALAAALPPGRMDPQSRVLRRGKIRRRYPAMIAAVGAMIAVSTAGLLTARAPSEKVSATAPRAPAACPAELPGRPAGKVPKGGTLAPRPATSVRLCRYPPRQGTGAQSLVAQSVLADSGQVAQLRNHLNSLSKIAPGQYSCPAHDEGGLVLVFNSGPIVTVPLSGCWWAWSPTAERQLSPAVAAELLGLVPLEK